MKCCFRVFESARSCPRCENRSRLDLLRDARKEPEEGAPRESIQISTYPKRNHETLPNSMPALSTNNLDMKQCFRVFELDRDVRKDVSCEDLNWIVMWETNRTSTMLQMGKSKMPFHTKNPFNFRATLRMEFEIFLPRDNFI